MTTVPMLALCAMLAAPALAAERPAAQGAWGIDLTARDLAAKPGDSFFDYAVGAWARSAEIPSDQTATGGSTDLSNLAERQLHDLMRARSPDTPSARMIEDFYAAFMDEARIETLDAAPLRETLAEIRTASRKSAIARLMGRSHAGFGSSFFEIGVGPDDKAPTVNTVFLSQGGLGLPTRDFYLEPRFETQRQAYLAYVARTFALVGWAQPEKAARQVLALETRIAEGSWSRAMQRDTVARYNPASLAELEALAPGFDWADLLDGAGITGVDRVVVGEKSAFAKIAAAYAAAPLDTLKAWTAFHLAAEASPLLSKRFVDSQFAFERALTGATEPRPRWKRAVGTVKRSLSELVGRAYVERHFPPSSKAAMETLVANLKTAMRGRLERVDWMSPPTRREALAKLEAMRVMVGYPDRWRDYSGLTTTANDLYGDVWRAAAFDWAWQIAKLRRPVDPDEWNMAAHTVNAYADPSRNVIVFPAAILQSPFFDPSADPAVNYGAIGGVIGHEITHMFDDQGRHYDAAGALRDWWAEADAARFDTEARKLVAQFDGYEVAPGLKVQGILTLGENIADLGGLILGLDAYRASLAGRPAPVLDGLSGEQRVFLGWAQVWKTRQRDDVTRAQIVSDPHAPARFRVDGPVRNIDAWYGAWAVEPDARLYLAPGERVRIW